jgi:phosphoglycerate dehydrogenase-like enzyme
VSAGARTGASRTAYPRAALSLAPGRLGSLLLPDDLRARLAKSVDLDDEPVDLADAEVRRSLADVEVLLTGWGSARLDAAALADLPVLRLIAHAGGSTSAVVDTDAADRAGVARTNAGEANSVPVAEYTVAAVLLAGTAAFVARETYAARQSFVDREEELADAGNFRRTVGVVGASRIGRHVLRMLSAFDLELLLHDPTLDTATARALGAELVPLDELVRRSSIVTLHVPVTPETLGLLDARRLALLPDGATVVNTSRGAVVDQDALVEQMRSGRLRAVLDVTEPDILPPGHPLYTLPGVFLTPHVAGAVGTEIARMGEMVVDEVERFVGGLPLRWQES